MIKGINILAQTEIMSAPNWCIVLFFIALILLLIFWVVALLTEFKMFSIIGFFSGLLLLLFVSLCVTIIKEPTGKYEYKVTIDDSVSMNEFYEKYKVIDTEGQIWTIMEK